MEESSQLLRGDYIRRTLHTNLCEQEVAFTALRVDNSARNHSTHTLGYTPSYHLYVHVYECLHKWRHGI